MTTHTALRVRQDGLFGPWVAPCACGSSWTAESKVRANRLRNKHIHESAVEAKRHAKRGR